MIVILLGTIIVITLLHYFELIIVQQVKIRSMLGLQDACTFDGILTLAQEKFVKFWIEIVLVLVGSVVGFKLG